MDNNRFHIDTIFDFFFILGSRDEINKSIIDRWFFVIKMNAGTSSEWLFYQVRVLRIWSEGFVFVLLSSFILFVLSSVLSSVYCIFPFSFTTFLCWFSFLSICPPNILMHVCFSLVFMFLSSFVFFSVLFYRF